MVQLLEGLQAGKIFSANFDDLCQVMMHKFSTRPNHGVGSVCGKQLKVFGKQSTHLYPIYIGETTVQCYVVGQ